MEQSTAGKPGSGIEGNALCKQIGDCVIGNAEKARSERLGL